LLLNVMLNVEELPEPATRATGEPNGTSSNVPLLFAGTRKETDPVGGAPLLAVTVPVTVTGASGEVLLDETVAEVVVMMPDAA
jgi:hypothetical protein